MTASVAAVVPQTRIRPFRETLSRVLLACCFSVSVPALAEESRVRVRAPSAVGSEKWVVGTLRRLDERSVLLEVERRTSAIEIPVEAVTRFEVSRGSPSPLRTAAYGAAGGGLGTAIATGVVAAGSGAGLSAEGVAFGFALSTAFGAAVGTVAGLGTRVLPLDRRSVRNGAWIGAAFGAAALGGSLRSAALETWRVSAPRTGGSWAPWSARRSAPWPEPWR